MATTGKEREGIAEKIQKHHGLGLRSRDAKAKNKEWARWGKRKKLTLWFWWVEATQLQKKTGLAEERSLSRLRYDYGLVMNLF